MCHAFYVVLGFTKRDDRVINSNRSHNPPLVHAASVKVEASLLNCISIAFCSVNTDTIESFKVICLNARTERLHLLFFFVKLTTARVTLYVVYAAMAMVGIVPYRISLLERTISAIGAIREKSKISIHQFIV